MIKVVDFIGYTFYSNGKVFKDSKEVTYYYSNTRGKKYIRVRLNGFFLNNNNMILEFILYFGLLISVLTNIYLFGMKHFQKKINKAKSDLLQIEIEQQKSLKEFYKCICLKLRVKND